jgi:hypothetical protein
MTAMRKTSAVLVFVYFLCLGLQAQTGTGASEATIGCTARGFSGSQTIGR